MAIYNYCDIIQSDLFEGIHRCDLSAEALNWCNVTVLATLSLPMADPIRTRNLYVSK